MVDRYNRTIEYMRISITDRCNLRCRYCMPDGIEQISMKDILTYEEILDVVKAAAGLGIRRIKITGGEPLARLGCADLIKRIKSMPGIEQVTMTTNGVLLGKYLDELMDAGLDAVNISLDSLDRERFRYITQFDVLDDVMEGIDKAIASGLKVKVNAVLQKGINEDEWLDLAELAKDRNLDVRFIELMPIGSGNISSGISNDEILERLTAVYPGIETDNSVHGNGPAVYYRIPDFKGSVGFISAIHGVFCSSCNRIRLTSQGYLKPCLCYGEGVDLRKVIRSGDADTYGRIVAAIREAVMMKPEKHCFGNGAAPEERSMNQIGG